MIRRGYERIEGSQSMPSEVGEGEGRRRLAVICVLSSMVVPLFVDFSMFIIF